MNCNVKINVKNITKRLKPAVFKYVLLLVKKEKKLKERFLVKLKEMTKVCPSIYLPCEHAD